MVRCIPSHPASVPGLLLQGGQQAGAAHLQAAMCWRATVRISGNSRATARWMATVAHTSTAACNCSIATMIAGGCGPATCLYQTGREAGLSFLPTSPPRESAGGHHQGHARLPIAGLTTCARRSRMSPFSRAASWDRAASRSTRERVNASRVGPVLGLGTMRTPCRLRWV
jgi:hypothetical protein